MKKAKESPSFVAMLRGINVSGQKIIKMEQLRKICEAIGLTEVKTYVQSGNVVFKSKKPSASSIAEKMSEAILRDLGFEVPVLIKTAGEIKLVIKNNPFLRKKGVDPAHLYVTFLAGMPSQESLKKLDTLAVGQDRFHVGEQEIYIYCPNGYGKTKLSNNAIERLLSVGATTRNWKTINALNEMTLQNLISE